MAIEKKFIREQVNRLLIGEYLQKETDRAGFGGLEIQRTPMGTRVSIIAERPGMVIGRKGSTINALTQNIQDKFNAENPQIEVVEAGREANLNAHIMARKVAEALERGWHFRRAGHSTVQRIMESGAKGCIVVLQGKLTGQRHRTEKFIAGHIKYCGETAEETMMVGYAQCKKKLGTIGCTVRIMYPDARLPDEVTIFAPGEKAREAQLSARPQPQAAVPKEGAATAQTEGEGRPERPSDRHKRKKTEREEKELAVGETAAQAPTPAAAEGHVAEASVAASSERPELPSERRKRLEAEKKAKKKSRKKPEPAAEAAAEPEKTQGEASEAKAESGASEEKAEAEASQDEPAASEEEKNPQPEKTAPAGETPEPKKEDD